MYFLNTYYPDLFVYLLAGYSSVNYRKNFIVFITYTFYLLSVIFYAYYSFIPIFNSISINEIWIFLDILIIIVISLIGVFLLCFYLYIFCFIINCVHMHFFVRKMHYKYCTDIINATKVNKVLFEGKYICFIIGYIFLRSVACAIFIVLEPHLQLSLSILFMGYALEYYDNKKDLIKKVLNNIKKNLLFYSVILMERVFFISGLIFILCYVLFEVLDLNSSLYESLKISYLDILVLKYSILNNFTYGTSNYRLSYDNNFREGVYRCYQPTGNEPSWFDPAVYQPTRFEPTGFEPEGYEPPRFEPPRFEATGNEATGFEATRFEPTGFEATMNQPTMNQPIVNQPAGDEPRGNETFASSYNKVLQERGYRSAAWETSLNSKIQSWDTEIKKNLSKAQASGDKSQAEAYLLASETPAEALYKIFKKNNAHKVHMPEDAVISVLCPDVIRKDTKLYFIHEGEKYYYRSNSFHTVPINLYSDTQPGIVKVMQPRDRPSLEHIYYKTKVGMNVTYREATYKTTAPSPNTTLYVKNHDGSFIIFPFNIQRSIMKYNI